MPFTKNQTLGIKRKVQQLLSLTVVISFLCGNNYPNCIKIRAVKAYGRANHGPFVPFLYFFLNNKFLLLQIQVAFAPFLKLTKEKYFGYKNVQRFLKG